MKKILFVATFTLSSFLGFTQATGTASVFQLASISNTTYLIDTVGNTYNSWQCSANAASTAYLLKDGSIMRPYRVSNPSMNGGAVGGDGTVLNSDDAGSSWTQQNGVIDEHTIWNLSGSPFQITGHVVVSSGVTLTIEPGVTVKFDSGKVMIVEGELLAQRADEEADHVEHEEHRIVGQLADQQLRAETAGAQLRVGQPQIVMALGDVIGLVEGDGRAGAALVDVADQFLVSFEIVMMRIPFIS